MYQNQSKKIHLNDVQCLELSNSEQGSRSLRLPMDVGKLRASGHLQPRERLKRKIPNEDVHSSACQPTVSGSTNDLIQPSSSDDCHVSQVALKSLLDFKLLNSSVSAKSDEEFPQDSCFSTSHDDLVFQLSARNDRFQPSFHLSQGINEKFRLASHLSDRIEDGLRFASHLSARIDEGFKLATQLPVSNEGFQPASYLLKRNDEGFQPASHLMSKAVSSFPSANVGLPGGDFMSARQFMNPIHHPNDGRLTLETSKTGWKRHNSSPETSRNSNASQSVTQGLQLVQKKPRIKEFQKNKLDRYFTPVISSPPSDTEQPLLKSREHIDSMSKTYSVPIESTCEWNHVGEAAVSLNSPIKSNLWSPIKKVPGSDTIYYSPNTSQNKALLDGEKANYRSVSKSLWTSDPDFEEPVAKETHKQTSSTRKCKLRAKTQTASNISASETKLPNSGEKLFPQQKLDDLPGNKYGLFGCSERELIDISSDTDFDDENSAVSVNRFLRLPEEILENILCRLPFMDLHLNVNRVCTAWNYVIGSPKFMPWKKTYHRLLKGDVESVQMMENLMKTQEMFLLETYLPSLIRCMKQFKPATARGKMDDTLRRHPKYGLAKDLLLERFKDCMMSNNVPNPWCIIAAIVILSESVNDIQEIIRCLLGGQSHCMASDLLDGLYNIASYLYRFKSLRLDDVWTGMHYRLYYALYLYENDSVSTVGQLSELKKQQGQQSIYRYSASDANLRLTHEQMRICNHHINPGEIIKIVAFAGTGKTTTLIQYTKMRPSTKFLLVVYNRSVRDHSKTRFPPNVDCYTGHSLAFRDVGRRYAAAKKLGSNVKVSDMLSLLPKRKGESLYVQAKFVVDTLNAFMASADSFVTTAHVPTMIMQEDGRMHSVDHSVQMKLADDAENIWKKMINLEDKSIRLPHDGYLKLWQLRKPKLPKYHVILIDEAQDLTPAVSDILLSQSQSKIMVGDPHQQIYSFRGAVNAMNLVSPTQTFYLTQSFRFGPEISFVAAACLELFKKETQKILVGNGIPGGILGDQVGQLAIICRSNFHLFCEIVKKCSYSDKNIKVAFAGGIESYGFDMIKDIYTLMTGQETESIRHPLVKCFVNGGFSEFNSYAKKTSDVELLGKINIVARFTHTIPSHIHNIRQKCISDPEMADIIFSTAHKAKGLEFDTVLVADDFLEQQGTIEANCTVHDEYNLLYVAVTRARKRLLMSPGLVKVLSRVGEKFHYLVSTKQTKESKASVVSEGNSSVDPMIPVVTKSADTSATVVPVVTVVKRKLRLSDGSETNAEVFSPQSVSEDMLSLRGIAGLEIQS